MQMRQAELDSEIETEKDTEQLLHEFRQQIKKITNLDTDDERILKPIIQSLIHTVEIGVDGSIKQIHYNFAAPSFIGA
ncbi:hypothetical protein [Paenibacillus sp. NRS-1781]|uniref:hypothetical protein n=1 Tax=Paenibacillus sp. NRS-1781 TaxID=3233905 RepID=UPI003D2734E4